MLQPVRAARAAMPDRGAVEKIRRCTIEHARAAGRYPKVLLLKRGNVKMKGARVNFASFLRLRGF